MVVCVMLCTAQFYQAITCILNCEASRSQFGLCSLTYLYTQNNLSNPSLVHMITCAMNNIVNKRYKQCNYISNVYVVRCYKYYAS